MKIRGLACAFIANPDSAVSRAVWRRFGRSTRREARVPFSLAPEVATMNEGPKRYARGTAEFHEYCGKHVQQMQAAIKLAVNTAIDERAPDPVLRVGELLVSRSVTFQTGGGSSSSEDAEIGHGAMGCNTSAPVAAEEVAVRAQALAEAKDKIAELEDQVASLLSEKEAWATERQHLAQDNPPPEDAAATYGGMVEGVPVAEGVAASVAVSTKEANSSYVSSAHAWAGMADLPKDVLLNAYTSVIAQIGPLAVHARHQQRQREELKATLNKLDGADAVIRTMTELRLSQKKAAADEAEKALRAAQEALGQTMRRAAESIGGRLRRDRAEYAKALDEMQREEPDKLEELSERAAALVNRGALKHGVEVEVVEAGKLQRARVEAECEGGDSYELSLWTTVNERNQKYEEGFDTSIRVLTTKRRVEIYASTKQRQTLSATSRGLAKRRAEQECGTGTRPRSLTRSLSSGDLAIGPSDLSAAKRRATAELASTSEEWLLLQYADAERTVPHLRELGDTVVAAVTRELGDTVVPAVTAAARAGAAPLVRRIVAKLKGLPRATIKTRIAPPRRLHVFAPQRACFKPDTCARRLHRREVRWRLRSADRSGAYDPRVQQLPCRACHARRARRGQGLRSAADQGPAYDGL